YAINRTARHPLGELRWLSQELKRELDKEIPSLLLRVAEQKSADYQTFLTERYRAVREFTGDTAVSQSARTEVRIVEYDPESETKILAGILFQTGHGSWDQVLHKAKALNQADKRLLLQRYLLNRTARWQKVGRAFENAYLRFEIVMDI